jgi:hypothetical protein
MADNNRAYNRPEHTNSTDNKEEILFPPLQDIISLEDLDIPETEVAGYTVDIEKYFTSSSEQQLRFLALEQIIHRHIDDFQAEKGLKSVVLIGDKEKVRTALDPSKLYLFDATTQIFELSLSPVDSHAFIGKINYLLRRSDSWCMPIRTWWWPGDWKNIIRLPFDIISSKDSKDRLHFVKGVHELMHQAEFERGLHETDDFAYTAYRERNTAFWDRTFDEITFMLEYERILMNDGIDSTLLSQTLEDLLDCFVKMRGYEAGKAPSLIENIDKEKFQTWLPDHDQLYELLGIKIRYRDILEHYETGACGERLQKASRWIAWRLSFDDEEDRLRQQALRFTEIHRMSEKEAKEHMQMVEVRLKEKRKAFEDEFEELYYPPEKMIIPPDHDPGQISAQEDTSPKDSAPAWYSHWKCINCKKTAKTPWNEHPGGECPAEKGGGSHNWEFQKKTDR